MKKHSTQKLFWKTWPYKAIIEIRPTRHSAMHWARRQTDAEREERSRDLNRVIAWCKEHFPDSGQRKEGNLSVFLNTKDELDELVGYWEERVIAVWEPESKSAEDMLISHANDVVRKKPWYGKFPIRARILYTNDLKSNIGDFKIAVNGIENGNWHAKGLLDDLLKHDGLPKTHAWGQPMHLYLANHDDAVMLKLQCDHLIERFEKIRAPD